MYTRVGPHRNNNINQKLEKEEIKINDLLEEGDDLVLEAKQQNTKLINFLSKKESLTEMIKMITEIKELEKKEKTEKPEEEEEEEKNKEKYPQIITDILLIEGSQLLEIISKDETLLELFFDYLFLEPTNCSNKTYYTFEQNWIKILNQLLNYKLINVFFNFKKRSLNI
jgi:hypothetical protein